MSQTTRAATERAARRLGAEVDAKYRLESLLGVGGTAAVYAARHRNGHRVALKMLHPELAGAGETRQRFLREAYLANRLAHDGVVKVLDDSVAGDGSVYLVMELLDGQSVGALARSRTSPLSGPQVLAIAVAVLDVLVVAHEAGIVHRDVKPENVFLCRDGRIRVLDFGIARHVIATEAMATAAGSLLGTPAFMAPEQALGRPHEVGPLTDVWAVGATMWNLLTGRLVHEGASAEEVLVYAATRRAPPLKSVMVGAPDGLAALVDRALAFEPAARWSSAASMRAEAMKLAPDRAAALAPLVRALPENRAGAIPPSAPHEENDAPLTGMQTAATLGWRAEPTGERNDRPAPPTPSKIEMPASIKWMVERARALRRVAAVAILLAIGLRVVWAGVGARRAKGGAELMSPRADTTADGRTSPARERDARAQSALDAANQLWGDASIDRALLQLELATTVDPAFAAAHLRYALLATWTDARVRDHYQLAVQHRKDLAPIDLALLDAYEPVMRMPPNLGEAEGRLRALATKYPTDVFVLNVLAFTRVRLGAQEAALETIDRAIALDPTVAHSWRVKGLALSFEQRTEDAARAFTTCTTIAPSATSCLGKLSDLAANEGKCTVADDYAHRLSAVSRSSDAAAVNLARSTYAITGSVDGARSVLEQFWATLPEAEAHVARLQHETSLCLLSGDFACVRGRLTEWEAAVASAPDEASHVAPARTRMLFELETGHAEAAALTASDYLRRRAGWVPDGFYDFGIVPRGVQYLAGTKTRDEYRVELGTWAAAEARRESLVLAGGFRWIMGYARAVRDPRDAREALDALPSYLPLPDDFTRTIPADESIGRVYLLAGDRARARGPIARAALSCRALEAPIENTWALLEHAELAEHAGDVATACATYHRVATRWPDPTSVTGAAARRRLGALDCQSTTAINH